MRRDHSDSATFARRRIAWALGALLLVALGSTIALLAATADSRRGAADARHRFEATSAQVAAGLQLALQHEQDLTIGAGAFISENPRANNAQFTRWVKAVRALQRYAEVLELGHAVIVPAARLPAFAAAAERDPVSPLGPDGRFHVVPAGPRPYYCLTVGAAGRGSSVPAGLDFCAAGAVGPASLVARDTGQMAYVPLRSGTTQLLSIGGPIYRGGVVPATVAARRTRFLGWIGMTVLPQVLLKRALTGHAGAALTLRYHLGASTVEFHRGRVAARARTATTVLGDGWTVRTSAARAETGVLTGAGPRALLLGGLALSLLLGLLVYVLGTGRARARRQVTIKTAQLRHQALHDALTDLPNRALIADRVDQLLARSRRHGGSGAVLFMDLDGFKNVNDTLGHEAGDDLLRSVAARLRNSLREVDTIGRLGGDEFVVLIDGESGVAPELVAERLLDVIGRPFELPGHARAVRVSASVGIATGLRDTGAELLRDADLALYRAKETGKNRHVVFEREMESTARRELELELDLRSALELDQFRLVYQPTYDLGDLTPVGVEALLRWDHPRLGIVEPDDFIALLEKSGQIADVGRWVLLAACEQMARWHAAGSDMGIAVNVSARQLDDDAIVADLRDALARSGLDPGKLTIEITETALMRNVQATALRLTAIRALGVHVAVDDFGTGYSSLASLQQFPIDTIKIDRVFTAALKRSSASDALIRTLVQLGRDLGITTVAEGVETMDQLDLLRAEHVDEVQGFLLSKPLEADAIASLILRDPAPRTAPEL
jgi:diguanylate cyclase (GGDEF)-like protein